MTPEKQSEQAWKDYWISKLPSDYNVYDFKNDFKSALKRDIEKDIERIEKDNSYSEGYKEAKINGLKYTLSLLETVKP